MSALLPPAAPALLKAFGRSLSDFEDYIHSDGKPLWPAERKLLEACRKGEIARIGEKRPEKATVDNRIRPGFLRFLMLGGDEGAPVHEQGVGIEGAFVDGVINLDSCAVPYRFLVWSSTIDGEIVLRDARIASINLNGSKCWRINADGILVTGNVFLRNGFIANREVRFLGAIIKGNFDCSGGHFNHSKSDALTCDGAQIDGDVVLKNGFVAKGAVRFLGAKIGGDLNCHGGSFKSAKSPALGCDRIRISGSAFLGRGFVAKGEVRFVGAIIGGSLTCGGGTFEHIDGSALSFDRAQIGGSVFFDKKFVAKGAVRLSGTAIGGDLECDSGYFESEQSQALICERAQIAGDVLLNNGFVAIGEVRFVGATINGNFVCGYGKFKNMSGDALNCDGMIVKDGFIWRKVDTIEGSVDLTTAHIASLVDDAGSWAQCRELFLEGFRYDRITTGTTDPVHRTAWLKQQPLSHLSTDFRQQPWEHCAKVLREMGHHYEARHLLIEKNKVIVRNGCYVGWRRWIHKTSGLLCDYGYSPQKVVWLSFLVWFLCGVYFENAAERGWMGPASPLIHANEKIAGVCTGRNWTNCDVMPAEYTTFHPYFYSLDLIFPLVDLQQDRDWAPIVATSDGKLIVGGMWARWIMWAEILFGWAASLAFAASLTGFFARDRRD